MNDRILNEILMFIQKCDDDFLHNLFLKENALKAKEYLNLLIPLKKENNSTMVNAIIEKLDFIVKQIDAINYHSFNKESILNLVSFSVTDYIINLIKNKRLLDPLLIVRYAYIELSKVLYYDVSYLRQTVEDVKKKICNAPVNVEKEKIFSFVVCTQWLELYTYILKQFDIEVIKRNIPGQDHVWGEIRLCDDYIVVVDATDYISSSIDLSNAKSVSPTVGFIVLPKEYSNMRLYDIFYNKSNREIAMRAKEYYKLNRDIDITLKYITSKGYPIERVIQENELFQSPSSVIQDSHDIDLFCSKVLEFFKKIRIPNNMDGYEIFAYYSMYIKSLPINIKGNISQKTIYVDSYSYKQKNMHKKFLSVPKEYLKYLEGLVYSKYYKYLSEEQRNSLFELMKKGTINGEQIGNLIAKYEVVIAEINRKLNLYYALNKLHIYNPNTFDTLGIQLYEPLIGKVNFDSQEEFDDFKQSRQLM